MHGNRPQVISCLKLNSYLLRHGPLGTQVTHSSACEGSTPPPQLHSKLWGLPTRLDYCPTKKKTIFILTKRCMYDSFSPFRQALQTLRLYDINNGMTRRKIRHKSKILSKTTNLMKHHSNQHVHEVLSFVLEYGVLNDAHPWAAL